MTGQEARDDERGALIARLEGVRALFHEFYATGVAPLSLDFDPAMEAIGDAVRALRHTDEATIERLVTPRGFGYWLVENEDYKGEPPYEISVQASSLATERRVWLGRSGGRRMHLTAAAARAVRDALSQWLAEGDG